MTKINTLQKKTLRNDLCRFNAKIIRGKFISITEKDYNRISKTDENLFARIQEFNYKIQLKADF